MNRFALLAVGTLFVIACASADSSSSKAFDRMKSLVGTWTGKAGEMKLKVTYKLVGAGSTLVEDQFPGEPHEMMTTYHMDNDKLVLTHYCAAHNQPSMKLIPGKDPSTLRFEFVSGSNMKPADTHMHSLKIHFVDKDHVVSEWTSYTDGKPSGTATFDLRRSS